MVQKGTSMGSTKYCIFLIFLNHVFVFSASADENSFLVHFQKSGKWSKKEVLEFKNDFNSTIKEFTTCHWEKLDFFSRDENTIWSYCEITNKTNKRLKCLNAAIESDNSTGGRDARFIIWIDGWTATPIVMTFEISPYFHRAWNHFCWTYSSKTGRNEIYHNGELIGSKSSVDVHGSKGPAIMANKDVYDSAIIIGQESDTMRATFEEDQAFYGQISEFNMWDKILDKYMILQMGKCHYAYFQKGNLISWHPDNFKMNDVNQQQIVDSKMFCRSSQKYVIFPQKLSLYDATNVCRKHGATIVVPHSEDENKDVVGILSKHKRECVLSRNFVGNDKGKGIWMGFEKKNGTLFEVTLNDSRKTLNFSNWDELYGEEQSTIHGNFCPFMYSDGKWGFERLEDCKRRRLCTICSFTTTPIFTLKGQCPNSSALEWNFYLTTDSNYQLSYFQGFTQSSKIEFVGSKWSKTPQFKVSGASNKEKLELEDAKSPVGRLEWNWHDPACSVKGEESKRNFTFSACDLSSQFTCSTGTCVGLDKRCNGITDCSDDSDEEECSHVDVPKSYRKVDPPQPIDVSSRSIPVHTRVVLEGIDFVDTHSMRIGATLRISMNWTDGRLKFKNINGMNTRYLLSNYTSNQLWLPLDHVIYVEAEIGRIRQDSKRIIAASARSESSRTIDPFKIREDTYLNGNSTILEMSQRFKIDYKCDFYVRKYPFDRHECCIGLEMASRQDRINIEEDKPSSLLTGSTEVKEFNIINVETRRSPCNKIILKYHESSSRRPEVPLVNSMPNTFSIVIEIKRDFKDHILTLFGPTFLFWFIAYLTLYLDIDDINNRSRTSVTVLLVVVSLLSSVKEDFPKTTYFKFVDLWFFWYVVNIFIIISVHIILENVEIPVTLNPNKVFPLMEQPIKRRELGSPKRTLQHIAREVTERQKMGWTSETKKEWISMELINTFFKISLPIATTIFNIIYFIRTNNHKS